MDARTRSERGGGRRGSTGVGGAVGGGGGLLLKKWEEKNIKRQRGVFQQGEWLVIIAVIGPSLNLEDLSLVHFNQQTSLT